VALSAYLRLVGQKSGEIKGSVTQKGREGKIEVIAVSHDIVSPRDAASGLPTGKRMHKPLVITKQLDASSVPLQRVAADNENLREWELQFYAPELRGGAGVGTEANNFTINLTGASIAEINLQMPNDKHPDLMKLATFEEIAFTYQSIQWTWTEGGLTASDDWEGRID
jgi:type VI secretion system secreted protein Hcp